MSLFAFHTLAYSEAMQKAGFTREQADALAKVNAAAMQKIINVNELVTKNDLEIALANTKHDILKWMVTGMVAQCALLVGILAFLK